MANSKAIRILDDMISAIGAVVAGETFTLPNNDTGTYNRTFRTVSRDQLFPTEPISDVVYVNGIDENRSTEITGHEQFELLVMISFSVEDGSDLGAAIWNARADIAAALAVDPERSTLAIDTKVMGFSQVFDPDSSVFGGGVVEVLVTYRHADGNPYS